MPSLKLSNLFRRGSARLSLKDRAADLRASVSASRRPVASFPKPGSEEAKAAWRAACHQHSTRLAPLHDCPELAHPTGGAWTTRGLLQAMEAGEITVSEYARLHPIASERELRIAEITHELRIGQLYALAYAGEYPVRAAGNADPEADEAHAAIAEHRAAFAAWEPHLDAIGELPGSSGEYEAAWVAGEPAAHAEDGALHRLVDTRASTLSGLLALASYIPEAIRRTGLSYPEAPSEKALHSMCDGILRLVGSGLVEGSGRPDPIYAAIKAHRTAWAACEGLDDGKDPDGYETAHDACTEALEAVEHTQPTTTAGLFALARYLDELLNREAGGQNVVEPSNAGHAFVALINACLGLADTCTADASDAPTNPDPILAAIAASRRAEAAVTAFSASVAGRRMTDAERIQEDAMEQEQRDARAAVWATVPETDEGRAALTRYVVFQAELLFGPDWRPKLEQEFCGDLLLALLAAFAPAAIKPASEGERA
ncbi:hypothetical protein [Methylobacterium sp.]|uniref:hypothetical protein n=1 Tax=Methylobacterium sp. TaxID=409 RepID=UPI000C4CE9AE|nr:hypothetical protein [Methylobacterium sp.]MBP28141.1 hypothetical protein [Methylobacterium sp.]